MAFGEKGVRGMDLPGATWRKSSYSGEDGADSASLNSEQACPFAQVTTSSRAAPQLRTVAAKSPSHMLVPHLVHHTSTGSVKARSSLS